MLIAVRRIRVLEDEKKKAQEDLVNQGEELKQTHTRLREDLESAYEKELFDQIALSQRLKDENETLQVTLEDEIQKLKVQNEETVANMREEMENAKKVYDPYRCGVLFC